MVSHHELEGAVENHLTLKRKCQEPAYDVDVGYAWCADLGLSLLIVGASAHLLDTQLVYVEEFQPVNVDVRIIPGLTAALREQSNAKNNEKKSGRRGRRF